MDVDRITENTDLIFKMATCLIVVKGEPVIAFDSAAFAYTEQGGSGRQIGCLISRHETAVKVMNNFSNTSSFDVTMGAIPFFNGIDAVNMSEIAGTGTVSVFGYADDMIFLQRNFRLVPKPEGGGSFATPVGVPHPFQVDIRILYAQR